VSEVLGIEQFDGICHSIAHQFYAPGMDHDDLFQEARIGAWQAMRVHRQGGASLRNLVAKFARRRVLDTISMARRQKRATLEVAMSLDAPAQAHTPDLELREVLHDHGADPAEAMLAAERENDLRTGFGERLSELERTCLAMVSAGRTYAEIEQALSIGFRTIDNACQRARRKLRPIVREAA
jgi:RNA polymerase sporulation-specific sigma factor